MSDTPKRIFIDAGIVYLNYGLPNQRELGETKGGSVFEVEVELRQIEADGQKGRTKGMKRKIREDAAITANILNLSLENIKLALPGAVITTNKLSSGWKIEMSEYLDNVTIIGETLEGKLMKMSVYNAMTEEGLNIPLVDKDESAVSLKFWANHEPGKKLWTIEELDGMTETPDHVDPGSVNFQELQEEVNWVNSSYIESEYTPDSWATLQSALVNATNVLNNSYSTQNEVDSALFNLNSAVNQLVSAGGVEVNKTMLFDAIQRADNVNPALYTPESYAIFSDLIIEAKAIYNDPAATQQEVNNASMSLSEGEMNLVLE